MKLLFPTDLHFGLAHVTGRRERHSSWLPALPESGWYWGLFWTVPSLLRQNWEISATHYVWLLAQVYELPESLPADFERLPGVDGLPLPGGATFLLKTPVHACEMLPEAQEFIPFHIERGALIAQKAAPVRAVLRLEGLKWLLTHIEERFPPLPIDAARFRSLTLDELKKTLWEESIALHPRWDPERRGIWDDTDERWEFHRQETLRHLSLFGVPLEGELRGRVRLLSRGGKTARRRALRWLLSKVQSYLWHGPPSASRSSRRSRNPRLAPYPTDSQLVTALQKYFRRIGASEATLSPELLRRWLRLQNRKAPVDPCLRFANLFFHASEYDLKRTEYDRTSP